MSTIQTLLTKSINTTQKPNWFIKKQTEALAHLTDIGFPTTKHESWKYLDIHTALLEKESLGNQQQPSELTQLQPIATIINGKVTIHTTLKGVSIKSLSNLSESDTNLVWENGIESSPFSYVNSAQCTDVLWIEITQNQLTPLMIDILSNEETPVSHPRILIHSKTKDVSIAVRYHTNGTLQHLCNSFIQHKVDKNCGLNYYEIQNQVTGFNVSTVTSHLAENSVYNSTHFCKDGTLNRHDTQIDFDGEHTKATLNGLALMAKESQFYNHLLVNHNYPNSSCTQVFKNILTDHALAEFSGLVFVKEKSHKLQSNQLNQNLLLSDHSRIISRPQLKIDADDVECSHGCTIGQLNPEEVFYITSRGLSEKEAKVLLMFGFAKDIIDTIEIPSIKKELESLLRAEVNTYDIK